MTRDPLVLAVSRRLKKKKYIFKCAVRARLVRVTALNQLLGMSKLLCIILYFQIKTNEKIIEKKTLFLCCLCHGLIHKPLVLKERKSWHISRVELRTLGTFYARKIHTFNSRWFGMITVWCHGEWQTIKKHWSAADLSARVQIMSRPT